MPTNLPLIDVISLVLQHTPPWVWIILVAITWLGLKQVADRVVTVRRLTIVPVVLGAYSLLGATGVFGMRVEVFACWAGGMALVVLINQWLAWPRKAEYLGAGRYAVPGSIWPLLTMWGVFGIRYVSTVTLMMHRELAHDAMFSVVMPVVYGALSGLFLARSLRVLRSKPATRTLSLA
ncbi:MAG: DUF6622 family protein [Rhizobacter sp.]